MAKACLSIGCGGGGDLSLILNFAVSKLHGRAMVMSLLWNSSFVNKAWGVAAQNRDSLMIFSNASYF